METLYYVFEMRNRVPMGVIDPKNLTFAELERRKPRYFRHEEKAMKVQNDAIKAGYYAAQIGEKSIAEVEAGIKHRKKAPFIPQEQVREKRKTA